MNDTIAALSNWIPLVLPEAVLLLAACVLFLGSTFRASRTLWGWVALAALATSGVLMGVLSHKGENSVSDLFASPVIFDSLAQLTRGIALAGGALLVLLSWDEASDRLAGEYHACLLVIVAGTSLVGAANELITLFLALEMISIPTYVLLYIPRHDRIAQEASMKYFLLSIFSSALLLFGFSYLYGLTGTTNLPAVVQALSTAGPGGLPAVALIALVLVVAGLGFRITAVPFHFYAPDVYQGTSLAGAALLSFVPKVAGFLALVRVLGFAPAPTLLHSLDLNRVYPGLILGTQASTLFWILAAATMTLGNVLAMLQDNVKRMLAYSSVAHAGYMLIGLTAAPYLRAANATAVPGGVEAILFYLGAYGATTLGLFAALIHLRTRERPLETVDDLAGLSRTHPGTALMMALFLFSLIGIPLTAGFVGKLFLFLGAVGVRADFADLESLKQARLFRILALVAAINAAIGAYYYLRLCSVMYLRNPLRPVVGRGRTPALAAVSLCAVLTLVLGVYPWPLWRLAQGAVPRATSDLREGR